MQQLFKKVVMFVVLFGLQHAAVARDFDDAERAAFKKSILFGQKQTPLTCTDVNLLLSEARDLGIENQGYIKGVLEELVTEKHAQLKKAAGSITEDNHAKELIYAVKMYNLMIRCARQN